MGNKVAQKEDLFFSPLFCTLSTVVNLLWVQNQSFQHGILGKLKASILLPLNTAKIHPEICDLGATDSSFI